MLVMLASFMLLNDNRLNRSDKWLVFTYCGQELALRPHQSPPAGGL